MRNRFRTRPSRLLGLVYGVALGAAFAVRAWWTLRLQRPIDGVWSDMAGYVGRAEHLLAGTTPGEPRILAMWPWGTHVLVAAEIAVFGRHSTVGIGLCQAAVGALAAPIAAALATRFVRSPLAALLAGVGVAFWHPHVVFSGYFMSEVWFTTAALLTTLFLVRHAERRRGSAWLAGLFLALTFVIRSQVALSAVLVGGGAILACCIGKRTLPLDRRALVALLLPVTIAVAVSSVRVHHLSGRWGMIASNEAIMRVFGTTDVARLEAEWTAPDGNRWTWWCNPTLKPPTPATTERFSGYIADPDILERIRQRRLAGVPWSARLRRAIDNVVHLVDNVPWPESEIKKRRRVELQDRFGTATFGVLALAMLGLLFGRRHPATTLILTAQLLTVVVVAALYGAEARYRVPYDPILIVLAAVGLVGGAQRVLRKAKKRPASAGPTW